MLLQINLEVILSVQDEIDVVSIESDPEVVINPVSPAPLPTEVTPPPPPPATGTVEADVTRPKESTVRTGILDASPYDPGGKPDIVLRANLPVLNWKESVSIFTENTLSPERESPSPAV